MPLADLSLGGVITWDGETDTNFATAGNWVGDVAPANSTTVDSALFLGSAQSDRPVLTGARSIMGVDFQSAGWTISGSTTLTVGANGIDSAGAGVNTILPAVTQALGATWTIGAGNTLDLGGSFGGLTSASLDLAGSGTLRFSGATANTFAGTITIGSAATLEIDKIGVAAIANGRVAVVNGTLKWLQAGASANTAQFTVNTGGVVDTNGFDAAFAFSGNERITLAGGTVQTGAGTWTFTGNNATYGTVNGTSVSTISGNVNFGGATVDRGITIVNNATGVDLDWAANILVGDSLSINGSVTASGSEAILSGNNAFTGELNLTNGVTVYLDHANAAGAAGAVTFNSVSADSTLALRGGINYAETGTTRIQFSMTPGLRSVSGNNTWNGSITNPGGSSNTPGHIQVDADTLTMNGSLSAFTSSSRQLAKTGDGALIYTNSANNIAATLYVNGGTFAQSTAGEVNVRGGNTALNGGTIAAPDHVTMGLGTGSNTIRFGGAGGGFAAYGADIEVNVASLTTLVWGGATNAHAPIASVSGGAVTALGSIYFGGAGYTGSETVSFSGGGGSGATATVNLVDGVVTSVTLTNGGTGYTAAPSVLISSAAGDGGTANFLANSAALILNSTISQHRVTLVDNIDLASASAAFTGLREIRVLDNATSSGDRAVIGGVISSSKAGVGVRKTGAGVLEYAAAVTQTYSGATSVTGGTLLVNGTHSGAGAYSVASAVLGGTGSISGHVGVLADGVLAPGDGGIESLNIGGNLSLSGTGAGDNATLQIQIASSGAADLLVIGGDLDLGAFDHLAVTGTADGGIYTIATFAGTRSGTFDTAALPGGYEVVYNSNSITIEMVPEPGSLGVVLAGGLGLLQRRRRRLDRP